MQALSAAGGMRDGRAGGRADRSYNGDSSKVGHGIPNKQCRQDHAGVRARQREVLPLNQRVQREIQKPLSAEGGTVA
jgi:hypothetical protein